MDSKFECRATAALLRSGESLAIASHAGAIAAVFCASPLWLCSASLLCWGVAVYFALRVKLDAALFELLAEDPTATALSLMDSFLEHAGLKPAASITRSLDGRRRGAIALWRKLAAAVAAQLILLGAAFLLR